MNALRRFKLNKANFICLSELNNTMPIKTRGQDHFFLPDLSSARAVFMLVLISELLVVIHQLATPQGLARGWSNLATTSIFVQWIVLTSSAFIYLARPHLKFLPVQKAVLLTLGGVVSITFIFSLAAQQLARPFSFDLVLILKNTVVALIIAAMLLRYFYIQRELSIQQQVIHTARLDSLLGHIRPHFLFNSMNIINSLIRIDPEKAEEAVEDLSVLFRSSLQSNSSLIPIQQEIDLSNSYLRIEQNRLGKRLKVNWNIKELPPQIMIPPFTLQPLVENAVYHGIQPLEEGGCINITIYLLNTEVQISVENPMPIDEVISRGNQVALKNIRSRLAMLYDNKARLTARIKGSGHRKFYEARVIYPYSPELKKEQLSG